MTAKLSDDERGERGEQGARGERGAEVRIGLRLYMAGDSPNSITALANLRAALAECQGKRTVDLEIIDILHDPERGLRDGITMTPMLVKSEPPPERRMLGNLRNRAALLSALGLENETPHRDE